MKPRLLVLSYTSVVLFVFTALIYRRDPTLVHVRVVFRFSSVSRVTLSVCSYKTLEQRPRLAPATLSILDLFFY